MAAVTLCASVGGHAKLPEEEDLVLLRSGEGRILKEKGISRSTNPLLRRGPALSNRGDVLKR